MSYEVNILVNGSRCKQYHHNGKIWIEAKHGSEYVLEIKNNTWGRILAVCSVDCRDILTGKPAVEGSPGYVINSFCSGKFDGYRISDEKVAKFVFGNKGESYAGNSGDESTQNCGVIGVRVFDEKVKPAPIEHHHHHHHWPKPVPPPYDPYDPLRPRPYWWDTTTTPVWTDHTYTCSTKGLGGGGTVCSSLGDEMKLGARADFDSDMETYSAPVKSSAKMSKTLGSPLRSRGFDMGTKWGEAKESRVVEVEFERGCLVFTTEIYYASRQSLIEMGVPIGPEKQVNFPQAFKDSKYAKPPKNWKG